MRDKFNTLLLTSPSISPIFANNPAYSLLTLSTEPGKYLESFTTHSLQLYLYNAFRLQHWTEISLSDVYPQEAVNDPEAMRKFYDSLKTDIKCYTEYVGARMGYALIPRRIAGFFNIYLEPLIEWYYFESFQKELICSLTNFFHVDADNCLW